MNKKKLLTKILTIILILSSTLSYPAYVGAVLSESISSSEKEITSLPQSDTPMLSKEIVKTEDKELADKKTSATTNSEATSNDTSTSVSKSSSSNKEKTTSSSQDSTPIQPEEKVDIKDEKGKKSEEEEISQSAMQSEATSNDSFAEAADSALSRSNRVIGNGLTVQVTGPRDDDTTKDGIQTKMRTFVDGHSTLVPDFILGLQVTNSNDESLNGTYIDIPLDCVPDGVTAPYETYTDSDIPIYIFDEAGSTLTDIVEECETILVNGTPETLRLHIKEDANQGVYHLLLRFKLNEEYYGRIPPGGTSWIVKPSYHNGVNDERLTIVEILTTANPTESVDIERQSPTGNDFSGTSITTLLSLNNRNQYEALLKPGSYSYIKVPAEFSVSGSITTSGTKEPLPALDYEGPEEETIDGILYYVYKKQHGNTQDTWTNWNHNSVAGYTFNRLYLDISVPSDYQVGKEFNVYFGAELTRENGVKRKLEEVVDYKKIEALSWSLETNRYHGHSSGLPPSCGIEDGAVGTRALNSDWIYAGYGSYNHNSSTRNMGMGAARNTRLELYSTSSGPARLNYNQVEVVVASGPYPNRASGPETGTQCWFKIEFMIGNENGTPDRKSDVVKSDKKTFTVSPDEMPELQSGEYISKVIVTPMGANGTQEGEWLPGNLISLKYQPKAWPNQIWPDGTRVPDRPSTVTMMWTLHSDNKTTPVQNGRARTVTYLPQNTVSARAQMISTDSTDRGPGDTVTYNLNGYNNLAQIGNPWIDPYLIIAVPKVLQLKDTGLPKIYTDLVGNGNNPTEVLMNKMPQSSSNAKYDFYEIDMSGIIQAPKRDDPAFRIPLEFQVAEAAPDGTYQIPFVVVSQKNKDAFSQLGFDLNNLEPNLAGVSAAGLGFHDADNYTAIKSGHTDLTISHRTGISANINIKSDTVDWSNLRTVSVSPGEQVEMKLTLKNTGNVNLDGVKLYNILPYSGDGRGSTGNVLFKGIDAPGSAKVWYSTEPVSNLPPYDSMELSRFNPSGNPSWSETAPPDLNDVTAFYIDFEDSTIEPGKEFAPIIKFEIPNGTEAYTAYNQFKYIVYDKTTNQRVLEAACATKGFSTEALNLEFTTGVDESITINNMPANVSKLREHTQDKIAIPSESGNIPTRTGYKFLGWDDKDGHRYQPGQDVPFAKEVNIISLEAQWTPITVQVTYDVNGGQPFDPPLKPYKYQYDQILEATDLPRPNPTREGYQFKGWSTRSASDTPDFGEGTTIKFTTDTTVYAVWEELYTLTVSQQTAGAFADKTLRFDYKVTFHGGPSDGEITYKQSDGKSGEFSLDSNGKGVFTFSLGEGESIIFEYFAEEDEVSYEISETAKNLYQPYVNATIDSDGNVIADDSMKTNLAEGTIGADKKHNVESYINERTDVPLTGIDINNNSSHMLAWIAALGLLLFSFFYLYVRRKRINPKD